MHLVSGSIRIRRQGCRLRCFLSHRKLRPKTGLYMVIPPQAEVRERGGREKKYRSGRFLERRLEQVERIIELIFADGGVCTERFIRQTACGTPPRVRSSRRPGPALLIPARRQHAPISAAAISSCRRSVTLRRLQGTLVRYLLGVWLHTPLMMVHGSDNLRPELLFPVMIVSGYVPLF
jgi:hypothetical protein